MGPRGNSPAGGSGVALAREACRVLSRLFITRRPSAKRVSCPFSSCCICRMAARSCCLLRQLCGDGAAAQRWGTSLRSPGCCTSQHPTGCRGVLAQELHSIEGPLRYLVLYSFPPFAPLQEVFQPVREAQACTPACEWVTPCSKQGCNHFVSPGRDAITHVSSCWSWSPVPLPHDKRRGKQLPCELCRGQEAGGTPACKLITIPG